MAKIVTITVNNTTLQTEAQKTFTVEDEEDNYPIEIEEFLVEHVGGRPNDRR